MRQKRINFETLGCAWTYPAHLCMHAYASNIPGPDTAILILKFYFDLTKPKCIPIVNIKPMFLFKNSYCTFSY